MSDEMKPVRELCKALIASLDAPNCPACGGWKRRRNSFCKACYKRLPQDNEL